MFASMSNPADFRGLLEYPPHGGLPAHRAAGAEWLSRHQLSVGPENVLVTSGAQNGMAISISTVARPGDLILTERLTYFGMKALTSTLGLRLEGVAMDEDGLLPDAFEFRLPPVRPRALYTVPTLHNPTTAVMPLERRQRIIEIARQYDVTIIEDDVFGFLMPDAPPPIQTLAPDITLHISSMSKSIAPGLRIGYLVAPSRLMPRLEGTMRALNYAVPPLMSELASRWIEDGSADRFADAQRRECRITPRHGAGHPARLPGDRRAVGRPASLAEAAGAVAAGGLRLGNAPARHHADRRRCLHGRTGCGTPRRPRRRIDAAAARRCPPWAGGHRRAADEPGRARPCRWSKPASNPSSTVQAWFSGPWPLP